MSESKILFPERLESRLRIYAYSIASPSHAGQLKIGQTTQSVQARVKQQLQTANITNYEIVVDETAEKADGTFFSDHDLRRHLKSKGFESVDLEWMRVSKGDVLQAIQELRTNKTLNGSHHLDFPMREEQQ